MSMDKKRKEIIKGYMMEKIFEGRSDFVERTAGAFEISRTTAYNILKTLIDEKKITKNARGEYSLRELVRKTIRYSLREETLSEDVIYEKAFRKYVDPLNDEPRRIWQYAFMEMMNNAIDHSGAESIEVKFGQNAVYTWVSIRDDGVGIFNKIAGYYKYPLLSDAIISLFKGRLTTDSEHHSGEGIFFSSKAVDHFLALSSGLVFRQDNTVETLETSGIKSPTGSGTLIYMALSNNTGRRLKDVFDRYTDIEKGFISTRIPVSYVSDTGFPVSRSQAQRLCFGLDKFENVILDFSGVEAIGQGFADEVFRVFARTHPGINLEYENAGPDVEKMIRHVIG